MHHEKNETQRTLGRIEGKLDSMQRSIDGLETKLDHVDGRLRSVEIRGGVISATVAAAISALGLGIAAP